MADDLDARLDGFRNLRRGWDSYKAQPPTETVIGIVRAFLAVLRVEWREPDRLNPSAVGGVGLTFYRPGLRCDRSVYVEFLNRSDRVLAVQSGSGEIPDKPVIVDVATDAAGVRVLAAWAREYLEEKESPRG